MYYDRLFKKLEKTISGGINDVKNHSIPMVSKQIRETEIKLNNLQVERGMFTRFLDKLEKILTIIKE